jgi:accessory gene regulator protein AgrB
MRFKTWILLLFLIIYIQVTFVIFFQAVVPSFDAGEDTTNVTFAVDSTVYMYLADAVRDGRYDPYVIGSLFHFPNTTWAPVFTWWLLDNNLLVMLLNYALFVASVLLLKKTFPISLTVFLPLLLLNPTSTTSILCLNKEVFDFFILAVFLRSRVTRNKWLLVAALIFALINRFEFCAVMALFVLSGSRFNPWRKNRAMTLFIVIMAINFIVPLLAGDVLSSRFEEAESANTIAVLDRLQMHYLYALVVVPKIAENIFGQLLNPQVYRDMSSYYLINFFNNFSYVIVLAIAAKKKLLNLQNDLVYLACFGAVIVAQSLAVQPRYFQFAYILLCLQIAQLKAHRPVRIVSLYERRTRGLASNGQFVTVN